uniref:Uncharacterized protein n=1 Tax=Anguilla anguilla TaxID=7936 RepID=A0A0E9SVX4_ANGAN
MKSLQTLFTKLCNKESGYKGNTFSPLSFPF